MLSARSIASFTFVLMIGIATIASADQPQIKEAKPESKKVLSLRLGLSAPFGAERAQADGAAVAAALSQSLGKPVTFSVLPPSELSAKLAAGELDIGWLTAMEYVAAAKTSNNKVQPVVKALHAGLPFYRSVLFTSKKNKLITTPADLKGKKIALIADSSSAGYVLPRQMLMNAGLTEAQINAQTTFVANHGEVCRAVLEGKADAGATVSNDKAGKLIAGCAETMGKDAVDLKVLSTSDPIPNDVFALRPDSTPEEFAALRAALIDLDKSNAGQKLLNDSLHADGFTAADDGDYAPLRASLRK